MKCPASELDWATCLEGLSPVAKCLALAKSSFEICLEEALGYSPSQATQSREAYNDNRQTREPYHPETLTTPWRTSSD